MTDLQNFVHRGGVLFADGLGNIKNTRTGHILTHGYFNDIADLHIISCLLYTSDAADE